MTILKNTVLSILLLAIGGAAFRLSFDAQVTLAIASGIDAELAWLYPGVVDAAILTGVLIGIWNPHLTKGLARYVWTAIALWTITSILGNAFHVVALEPGRISVDPRLAIAVNTVPAVTLFLTIHLATTTAFRRTPTEPTPPPSRRRRTAPVTGSEVVVSSPRAARRTDIPGPEAAELATMAETMSYAEIATRVRRSKSWVGAQVKAYRDQKDGRATA